MPWPIRWEGISTFPRPEQCAGATGGDPFQRSAAAGLYAELAPLLLGDRLRPGDRDALTVQLIDELAQLSPRNGLPSRLRDAGVDEAMLPRLAADAMLQQRLLVNNPREVGEADALAIYRAAY